jgi:hypothetical protein
MIDLREAQSTFYLLGKFHDLSKIEAKERQTNDEFRLHSLCRSFLHSRCSDHRDTVYSLLSLANDIDRNSFVPDYSEKNTVIKVFIQVSYTR